MRLSLVLSFCFLLRFHQYSLRASHLLTQTADTKAAPKQPDSHRVSE